MLKRKNPGPSLTDGTSRFVGVIYTEVNQGKCDVCGSGMSGSSDPDVRQVIGRDGRDIWVNCFEITGPVANHNKNLKILLTFSYFHQNF